MKSTQELFDVFWRAYPRRTAKRDAYKAFQQANVDEEVLTLMLRALQWQVRTWSEMRYVPYPATWIRGERWMDENPNEYRGGAAMSIAQILAELGQRK